jgi:hypothetical protein
MQKKMARKVYIYKKMGKNVRSISYFQKREKKSMVNKNANMYPAFSPFF